MTFAARYCDALYAAMMTQFLYMLSCSFRFGVPGNCGKLCTRKLHKLVPRHARAVRTSVVRVGR